jgi:hypothetical protein
LGNAVGERRPPNAIGTKQIPKTLFGDAFEATEDALRFSGSVDSSILGNCQRADMLFSTLHLLNLMEQWHFGMLQLYSNCQTLTSEITSPGSAKSSVARVVQDIECITETEGSRRASILT